MNSWIYRKNNQGYDGLLLKIGKFFLLAMTVSLLYILINHEVGPPSEIRDCDDHIKWTCSSKGSYSTCIDDFIESPSIPDIETYIITHLTSNPVLFNTPHLTPSHSLTRDNILLLNRDNLNHGCDKQYFRFICPAPCIIKENN